MEQEAAHTFTVQLTNMGGSLEVFGGVTYPHHIFGHQVVLQNEAGEVLLPGLQGEVHLQKGQSYSVEHIIR